MHSRSGFTLVELAIVLVIIGLLVGGVLVGRDLIAQAGVRAATTTLARYDVAVTAFRTKYGSLPGDMFPDTAARFGFAPRAGGRGRGDNNSSIESNGTDRQGLWGESALLWRDVSQANMIPDAFNTATDNGVVPALAANDLANYLPRLDLATGLFIHAYNANGKHYYLLASMSGTQVTSSTITYGNIMNPVQAGGIDTKVDDGVGDRGIAIAVDSIATNTPDTGAGALNDCLNADGSYNRDGNAADMNNCRMAIRFNF